MESPLDLFHIMKTMRPMRRLKPDNVPDDLLEEVLDAAVCAPNSLNTQPYNFIVVRDKETKSFFGENMIKQCVIALRSMFPSRAIIRICA